jgi:hypothetical protein
MTESTEAPGKDTNAAAAPEPRRTLITTRSEYMAAAERLFGLAQRELRIFDPDLEDTRIDTPGRIELLQQFLRRSVDSRLYISVRDPEFIKRSCPRLVALLTRFSATMFIWRAEGEAARVQDCFILADRAHVVRRPVAKQPRGVFILDDPREGLVMHERFKEIWDTSVPAVSASTSGL